MTQGPDPAGTTAAPDVDVLPDDDNGTDQPIGAVEAAEADVAEQRTGVRATGHDPEPDWEADEADAADQRAAVSLDEDEYRG